MCVYVNWLCKRSLKQTVSTPQQLYGIIQGRTRNPFQVLLLSDLPEGILYVIFLKAGREVRPQCSIELMRVFAPPRLASFFQHAYDEWRAGLAKHHVHLQVL